MFMYFGKTHYSTSYGVQLENVTCDRCNCEYQYELARYGLGISHSHYGLGESNANHKAHGRSSENLNERLAFDAELVPCPKCQWVNEALVERYRHGHFKSLVMNVIEFAAVTLLLVFAVCLPIHAWVAEYAQLAGIILIMTSVGCVLAVIASVLIRRALQARVDPNKLYPARPRLPVGTPPALLVNRDTGVLEPIDHAHAANEHVGRWNLFQLGRHEFPNRCCKCHSGLDVTRKHRLSFRGFILDLPICVRCDRKTKVTKIVSAVMIVCILMAVVVLILPTFGSRNWVI